MHLHLQLWTYIIYFQRLSTYTEVSDAERRNKVNFDLLTPSSSFNILNEQADPSDKPLPNIKQETSKIFFHIIPSDPNTDLSALRTELSIFSTNLLKSHNLEVQLVTSDAFIASAVRHISTSSEGQSSTRSPFKSSNESLSVLALNNVSRMALEHSETSDEDNTRRVSCPLNKVFWRSCHMTHDVIYLWTNFWISTIFRNFLTFTKCFIDFLYNSNTL